MEICKERPDPDKLLKAVTEERGGGGGKLKIFFGYAAGVGKTYAMLEAAHLAQMEGIDVVAGYIEPHARPETMRLLEGLEQLPVMELPYKGIVLKEFDLDGALKRHPKLILVDELAHSNGPGCRHKKRYQDIEELLKAGIDVYTTVNVQHLESLNDVVTSITGITVNERVPDSIFDSADQVKLVDVEPADLIVRLEQGKVYKKQQAKRAMDHFFHVGNLAALREIALRRTADRLNHFAVRDGDMERGKVREHIMVCLSPSPTNARVIRTAARMAEAFHGRLTGLYVENAKDREMGEEDKLRLQRNRKLAEDLGANITTVYGDNVAVQISGYAKVSGVTKIVIGRTNGRKRILPRKNLIDSLTEMAPGQDIYVIPDQVRPEGSRRHGWKRKRRVFKISVEDVLKTALVLILASLAGILFFKAGIKESNIITVYIMGVLIVAAWTEGRLYGAAASVASVLLFNFLFTVPRFSLDAYDPGYPITFCIMLLSSFLTSSLTIKVKDQAAQASKKAYRTEILLETSRKLQKARGMDTVLEITANQIKKLLNRTVVFYPEQEPGRLGEPVIYPEKAGIGRYGYITEEEQAVARWVYKNDKHAGATTNTLPSAKCLYLAVRGQSSVIAVVGIAMDEKKEMDPFERNLLIAILDECGLAAERMYMEKDRASK